jgi:hypothetical protein
MRARLALGACAIAAAALLPACGPGATGPCDEPAITEVIGSIVAEEGLVIGSVDSIRCSQDWALLDVALTPGEVDDGHHGPAPTAGVDARNEVFLMHLVDGVWVWKAPETVCETGEVPEDLLPAVCP